MTAEPPKPSSRRPLPLRRKLVFSALVFVAFFGGLEVLLRLVWTPKVPLPPVGHREFVKSLSELATNDPFAGPLYREEPHLLWSLIPGAKIETNIDHRHLAGEIQPIQITINDDGHRGRRSTAPSSSDTLRILCLGDSNFFGYPLDDEHVFPHVLEQALTRLHPKRRFEVINGGVPGYTIVQGQRLYDKLFRGQRFEVVLLSFLNNDAWRQPQTDADLFARQTSFLHKAAKLSQNSRVCQLLALLAPEVSAEDMVERVPLDEYVGRYRALIATVRGAGGRVMIVDFRTHPEYEPYSAALRAVAIEERVGYMEIHSSVGPRIQDLSGLGKYRAFAARVERRWGPDMMRENPYLWYYAEERPEHLNEVGVAWLADLIAPKLFGAPK